MKWVRVVLVLLAVPNIITGIWALVDPQGWFDNFPGWAPRIVSAHPPFNEHLATDAGAGLLATGVVALLAFVWFRRDVLIVAMVTYLCQAAPHLLFHLANPSDLLTSTERATAELPGLILAVVAAAGVLLWAVGRFSDSTAAAEPVG